MAIQRAEELMQQIKDLRKEIQNAKTEDAQKYSSELIARCQRSFRCEKL